MKIILLGAPGSGKGTVAQKIYENFELPQISTGDLLRDEIKKGTKLGKQIADLIENGNFVTDDMMIKILKNRLKQIDCQNGYVLDGFPRNLAQAKILENLTKIDVVFYIDTPLEVIKQRINNRRVCEKCSKVYNTKTYAKATCADCGGKLVKRKDDTPKIIEKRFKIYQTETAPLIDYYKTQIVKVDGTKSVKTAFEPVKKFLEKKVKKIGCEITH